jgi:hypothetical protein
MPAPRTGHFVGTDALLLTFSVVLDHGGCAAIERSSSSASADRYVR